MNILKEMQSIYQKKSNPTTYYWKSCNSLGSLDKIVSSNIQDEMDVCAYFSNSVCINLYIFRLTPRNINSDPVTKSIQEISTYFKQNSS